MQKLEETLANLGLSNKESKVYIALLQLEHTTVQWIAKKSGINRTTIYDILESLQKRGLARFYVKNESKYFVAADPEKLIEMEEEKIRKEQVILENLKKTLPEIRSIYNAKKIKPKIQFFDSTEHIEEMYQNMYCQENIKHDCLEYASWSDYKLTEEIFPKDIRDRLLETRKKNEIFIRQVAIATSYTKPWVKGNYAKKRSKAIRLIPDDNFDFGANLETYGNKIVIIQFNKETGITGMLIESKELVKMIRTMFEFMWEGAKKYKMMSG